MATDPTGHCHGYPNVYEKWMTAYYTIYRSLKGRAGVTITNMVSTLGQPGIRLENTEYRFWIEADFCLDAAAHAAHPQLSIWDKIGGAFAAFGESFEFEAGAGIGLGGAIGTPLPGIDAVLKCNLLNVTEANSKFDLGNKCEAMFIGKTGPYEVGPHSILQQSDINYRSPIEENSFYKCNDTIELWSSGLYLVFGGEISVSFNYKCFFGKISQILN